jgi:hypothetical protein
MPTLLSADFRLDRMEFVTVIAALHHWSDSGRKPEELEYIACGFGEHVALDTSGIVELIERFSLEVA